MPSESGMRRGIDKVIRGLAPINCFYNKEPKENGKCYCSTCIFNQDPEIKLKIKNEGCEMHKSLFKKDTGEIYFVNKGTYK
jgi:hypothetical protein